MQPIPSMLGPDMQNTNVSSAVLPQILIVVIISILHYNNHNDFGTLALRFQCAFSYIPFFNPCHNLMR